MNMIPQAHRLACQTRDGKLFRVIGWTGDPAGLLYPIAVPFDGAGRPEVLTGELHYHVSPCGCGS